MKANIFVIAIRLFLIPFMGCNRHNKKIFNTFLMLTSLHLLAGTLQGQVIFEAIENDNIIKVESLIIKDTSLLLMTDDFGNTALHLAAIKGSVPMIELLVSKGSKINSVNNQLNTALHLSIMNSNDGVSEILINKGSNLEMQNIVGKTPLHLSVRYNRTSIAGLLIKKRVNINSRDDQQRTPLALAARESGNVEIAKLLISQGACINTRDSDNNMPLNFAAWKCFNGLIDLLLDMNAEFDKSNNRAYGMAFSAANCGSLRLFNNVSENSEELFSNEFFNKDLMQAAISGGSLGIVKILSSKGTKIIEETDIYGWTPLHYATLRGHGKMLRFLVKQGFDINRCTISGKSSYNIAEEVGNKDEMKLILNMGGDTLPQQFPILTGDYFGQPTPLDSPKVFAPDLISTSYPAHASISISTDRKEIYWSSKGTIWMTKFVSGVWSKPQIASFSLNKDVYLDNAFISPDNTKIFFTLQQNNQSQSKNDGQIWYAERMKDGWSEPQSISSIVNSMKMAWQFAVSGKGTIFFSGLSEDGYGNHDIYYSKIVNGEYSEPRNLGSVINTDNNEITPFVDPDESYLIFYREGEDVLYISFKGHDNIWLKPVILGDSIFGKCPIVSPDGKYLFYINESIMWVSADIIERMRPFKD